MGMPKVRHEFWGHRLTEEQRAYLDHEPKAATQSCEFGEAQKVKLSEAVISDLPFRRVGASKEFWIVVRGSFFYFESQWNIQSKLEAFKLDTKHGEKKSA